MARIRAAEPCDTRRKTTRRHPVAVAKQAGKGSILMMVS